jgi:hypothetical protein
MAILHKFKESDFGDGFGTTNAILTSTPYLPEVLIIGTFNPGTPNANFADFFYGRNFFWPAFKNLFVYNQLCLNSRRIPNRGGLPGILNPSFDEIKVLCTRLKLSFCDLINQVLYLDNPNYEILANDNIIFNQQEYNLIQDGQSKGILGLENLNELNQIQWSTDHIISYLLNNPQIHSIYFTRKPTGIWGEHWNAIINHDQISNRFHTNIFTPSAQGKPVFQSMERLINHWIHSNNANFGKFNQQWLISNGVEINIF